MSAFETWWHNEGSGMSPLPGEDAETHVRRVSEIAWKNGGFIAESYLLDALKAISSNPHVNLGDLIYQVREREGMGWDGDAVKAWSDACDKVDAAIAKAEQSKGASK